MTRAALSAVATWCATLLASLSFASSAQRPASLPDTWIDIGSDAVALRELVEIGSEKVDNGKFWFGYSFFFRDDVHIVCGVRDDGRYADFRTDDVSFHFDDRDNIVADRVACSEAVGLFVELDRARQRVTGARVMTLQRAAVSLEEPVVWAGTRAVSESVAYLRAVVLANDGTAAPSASESPGARDRLLAAIALHRHPSALDAVEEALNSAYPRQLREGAVFWIGRIGGQRGAARLLELARGDGDVGVRKQAVFWLGQLAGRAATADLADLTRSDPDVDVRRAAVFALSQSEDDEAIEVLIALAKNSSNRDVVKSALFWLGESGDPRAVELFEELLFGRR